MCQISLSKSTHLRDSPPALTKSRFLRLLLLCPIVGLWPLFIVLFSIYRNVPNLVPWPGWAAVHSSFHVIRIHPFATQPSGFRHSVMITHWFFAVTAFILFGIFAFGDGVREDLRSTRKFFIRILSRQRVNVRPAPSQRV